MLRLAVLTGRAWAERAQANIDEILIDHAHCEKKAAGTAVSLIFRYPDQPELQEPLSRLAREELAHFEEVLRVLQARGVRFGKQRPSRYAARLTEWARRAEPGRLLDSLIVCAFIEARSCERMQRLAEVLEDETLRALYSGLLEAEARHHALYVDLALALFPEAEVRARLASAAEHEAEVIRTAAEEPRIHAN